MGRGVGSGPVSGLPRNLPQSLPELIGSPDWYIGRMFCAGCGNRGQKSDR